jgi:hypothetical protein
MISELPRCRRSESRKALLLIQLCWTELSAEDSVLGLRSGAFLAFRISALDFARKVVCLVTLWNMAEGSLQALTKIS